MIREIRYKISADTKSIEPKTRQWAGMQYEDNATEVVFDLSAVGTEKALYRIDFNSVTAGYFPGENLTPDSMPSIRRGIPKYLTQYGGELEAVAVITPLTDGDEPTGEVLSYPVTLYFTGVSRSGEGEAEFIPSLSAMEESVRKIQEAASEDAAIAERARLEIENAGVSAESLLKAKLEAEALISTVEQRLENGEFQGEKGEAGEDAITDQTYNPESENAQSGKAVAEAVSTKANLQIKEIDVEGAYTLTDFIEGAHIYELSEVYPIGDIMCELYFTNGLGIRVEPNKYPFTIGKKYLIETHLDDNGGDYIIDVIAEVIDLEDKVNLADIDQSYSPTSENPQSGIAVAEALANFGGGGGTWQKNVDITITEEVNGIYATVEEFPQIAQCKEFITRIVFPKTETALTLGAIRFHINDSWFFRVNSASATTSGSTEIRCHTIIADTLIHTVGNESTRGHSNVVGNAYILVGNQLVDIPQEISILLNDSATYLPIGTKIEIYGKVEG